MKTLFKIPYYVLILAVGLLGLLLISTMAPIGNLSVKIVKSGSMEPTIPTGSIVVIRPAPQYGVGDVITFGADTKTQVPTTHRIVETSGRGFVTKGDGNDAADPKPVQTAEVRGKVVFSIPYVGFVLDFAKQPLGFILLVGVPALLVILDELGKIWREIKRMRRKKGITPPTPLTLRGEPNPQKNSVDGIRKRYLEPRKPTSTYSVFPLKTLAASLIIIGPLFGLSSVGSTISYYRENELSLNNILQASNDFGLPPPPARVANIESFSEIGELSTSTPTLISTSTETSVEVVEEEKIAEVVEEEEPVLEEEPKPEETLPPPPAEEIPVE